MSTLLPLLLMLACPRAKLLNASYAPRQSMKAAQRLLMVHGALLLTILILLLMKLSELQELLNKALAECGPDAEILLCFEQGALDEGYDEKCTEGITDVRIVEDWPLPGKSLSVYEGEKDKKVILFYDNKELDSAIAA